MSALQRNCVQISGSGQQTVILAHGFGCNQKAWDRLLPRLESLYTVVRYDLTGFGRSDRSTYDVERHGSLRGHAEDLLEVCRELRLEDAFFVGHSVSGMIGILSAGMEPERFRSLVLIAGSPRYLCEPGYEGTMTYEEAEASIAALGRDYDAWCHQIVPRAVGTHDVQLERELMQTFVLTEPEIAAHFLRTCFFSDYRAALPAVAQPVLAIQSRCDPFVPEGVGRYIARTVRNGELMFIGRGGHFPHMGVPYDVGTALHAFFAR